MPAHTELAFCFVREARDAVTLALEIGARAGEIQSLKWSDIDFDTRMVNIFMQGIMAKKQSEAN
ncbi:tyrosine-type recombinase/integrase [Desulfitobacterium chlororespirans]|uniref:tyrosine-type recombinase/integrase n=1 Tax=Desulfitobacterium chlororespirans TaxID=51616 RepID=UPI000932A062